jgi:2-polyprenyl-3-methyl-5-hydroxy-6-metoxy-1,4-benzoquinol methylase
MGDAAPPTTWSEERVRRLVEGAATNAGYQRVALPYGLSIPGTDRSSTAALIFPADLAGKTVLDVGSRNGYFCFEALRRGAADALGIEIDEASVEQARQVADCLGLPARFRRADVEHDAIGESFDYVLGLNVLHHLDDPLAALERLVAATRERLVLEVASIGRHDRRKLGLSRLAAWVLARHPVLYAAGPLRSGQRFFITAPAIRNLLLARRGRFGRIDILPSPHKGRYLAVAHRRRIGRLLVVAGPTAAGKSTLIERLAAGDLPEVAAAVGFDAPRSWRLIGDRESLRKFSDAHVDRLVLHYDFARPLYKATPYERDTALELLACADVVTIVTVWTDPARLRRQMEASELRQVRPGAFEGSRRHVRIWKDYHDAERVAALYRAWLAFAGTLPGTHHVVSLGAGARCYPAAEWEARRAAGEA